MENLKTFDECKDALIRARDEISKAYKPVEALVKPWHDRHLAATEAMQRRYAYRRSDGSTGLVKVRIDHFAPSADGILETDPIPPGWRASVELATPGKPYDHTIYGGRRTDSTDYRALLRVQQWAEDWMAGKISELPPSDGP